MKGFDFSHIGNIFNLKSKKIKYDAIIPKKNDWPIVKLAQNRDVFLKKVEDGVYERLLHPLRDRDRTPKSIIETTIYLEKLRIKNNPWKSIDPKDEPDYWKNIQEEFEKAEKSDNSEELYKEIIKKIIHRFTYEIAGDFKKPAYNFARAMITLGFARLLNSIHLKSFTSLFNKQLYLDQKIKIVGETEHIRALARKGTLIIVPTHFSNLDSVLISWVIQYLGLPAFMYGAGLNLFNIKIIAYLMNMLGAYKVDRRKKNPIYLETLKTYSNMILRWKCHSLFFPGGTRSRNGQIETHLKLGLLESSYEAQKAIFENNEDEQNKIFIVPLVINYQFTLEAPTLIKQYLKIRNNRNIVKEYEHNSSTFKVLKFIIKFFSRGSELSVSIGKGMDILGNYVDDQGRSYDNNGNLIELRDYFTKNGKIVDDFQRDTTYVKHLAEKIVAQYYKYNFVYTSHLLAYTAFELLKSNYSELDLHSLLKLPTDDLKLNYLEFKELFKNLRKKLKKLAKDQKLMLDPNILLKTDNSIKIGLKNLGLYHVNLPLVMKKNEIVIQDTLTLFYYHNRLEGYNLINE